jgi:hypothetical protein
MSHSGEFMLAVLEVRRGIEGCKSSEVGRLAEQTNNGREVIVRQSHVWRQFCSVARVNVGN